MTADAIRAFAFTAQNQTGEPLTGTLNAADVTDASRKLHALNLHVMQIDPIAGEAKKTKRLDGDDFQAFNAQLAQLATAGLPIEKGLRLIAQDMRSGSLSATVNQVAGDLESGRSLPEAFAAHAKQFPPLYSDLISAGVRTGNLAGMLLGLGRHIEMVRRLRAMLWRAMAYPITVLASLLLIVALLGLFVLPKFKEIFVNFRVDLPAVTELLIAISNFLVDYWPILLGVLILLIVVPPIALRLLSPTDQQRMKELLLVPIPVLGRALKMNLLARWCDALRLGVAAGLDLPQAISLAGQAVGSPALMRDGELLTRTLASGQALTGDLPTRWIPGTVMVVLSMASSNSDLPAALNSLSEMFQQQAELKVALIPAAITPVVVILIAGMIGFVVIGLFAPMIALIQSVSGPMH